MAKEPLIVTRGARMAATTPLRVNGALRRAEKDTHSASGQPPAPRSFVEPRFGRDFSQVQTHGIFINGPGPGSAQSPRSPPPAPKQQPPPAKAAPNCPTDIRVALVDHPNDRDFGQKAPITGWGGIAMMEVLDPSGKDWGGTKIHENLKSISNTCGDQGKNACSNLSGENGRTGSSFEVGKESNFLGFAKLPASKNRFYDLHVFADRSSSLLHRLNRPTCEIQCEQFFDCGGRRFGPDFVITYGMTRDSVPRKGGAFNGVTRVQVRKTVKTAPPVAPAGVKP